MPLKSLIIKIYPRLHITLIGMNECGYRINGGVGFAIKEPALVARFVRTRSFSLLDKRAIVLMKPEISRIKEIIDKEKRSIQGKYNIKAEIEGEMPTHIGFGSSSAIRLACLEALYLLNQYKPQRERLVLSSGRGGTSGIGINSYFDGGIVFDLGRKGVEYSHKPSSLSEKRTKLPLVMQRMEMPNWKIGICIPENISCKSEVEEIEFFNKTCPISMKNVYKVLYDVIYGVYSAIRENDKQTFCAALKSIQKCAWKKAERQMYGRKLLKTEKQLYQCGATAVGMSSLGPGLFFMAEDIEMVIGRMKKHGNNCRLIMTEPANLGREIIHV